eukprot:s4704_g2.t1
MLVEDEDEDDDEEDDDDDGDDGGDDDDGDDDDDDDDYDDDDDDEEDDDTVADNDVEDDDVEDDEVQEDYVEDDEVEDDDVEDRRGRCMNAATAIGGNLRTTCEHNIFPRSQQAMSGRDGPRLGVLRPANPQHCYDDSSRLRPAHHFCLYNWKIRCACACQRTCMLFLPSGPVPFQPPLLVLAYRFAAARRF